MRRVFLLAGAAALLIGSGALVAHAQGFRTMNPPGTGGYLFGTPEADEALSFNPFDFGMWRGSSTKASSRASSATASTDTAPAAATGAPVASSTVPMADTGRPPIRIPYAAPVRSPYRP